MRLSSFSKLIALGWALFATLATAQQDFPSQTRGTGANTAYAIGDLDTINLFNGNLSLALPIGPRYPVGGELSYGLTLTYNSNAWDFEDDSCLGDVNGVGTILRFQVPQPDPENNAGLGWNLTLGHFETIDGPEPGAPRTVSWTYISPDGGQRKFSPTLHPGTPEVDDVYYSQDGTYLRGKEAPPTCPATPPGANGSCRTVEFPNGIEHIFFDVGTAAEPNLRVSHMRDRFGNQVEVLYDDFTWTLTDSHGRQQIVSFDPAGAPRSWRKVISVDVTAFDPIAGTDGQRAVYTISYQQVSIERHRHSTMLRDVRCIEPPPAISDPRITVDLPTQIRQPDGSFYSMAYDHDETSSTSSYIFGSKSGALRQLRIPTGAFYRWDYDHLAYSFLYSVPADFEPQRFAANVNFGVIRKEIFDDDGTTSLGRWLYQPDQGPFGNNPEAPPCYHSNRVTDPQNNWTVHYFSTLENHLSYLSGAPFTLCELDAGDPASPLEGPYLSQEIYEADGSSDGWKRRSIWLDFETNGPLANGGRGAEIRYPLERTIYHDDSDHVVDITRSNHDGLGHYRQEVLTSSFPEGRNTETTFTHYNPNSGTHGGPSPSFQLPPVDAPWLLETFDLQQVTEGIVGEGHRATTDFCFDTDTGFLKGQRRRNPAGGSDSDILTLYTPDGLGNRAHERTWGGDSQPAGSLPVGCETEPSGEPQYHLSHAYRGGVLASSEWLDRHGNTFLSSVDDTVDVPSGLVRASRDPAGFETRFTYDIMGRVVTAVPDEGAWTQTVYTYPRLAAPDAELEVEVRHCREGAAGCQAAGNQLNVSRILFDRRARQIQEWRQIPTELGNDEVSRRFEYDAQGRQTKVTEWDRPDAFTEFIGLDRFGRPASIRRPDLSEVTFEYTGDRIVRRTSQVRGLTGMIDRVVEEVRDAQRRLIRVSEQSAGTGAFVDTTYQYDEGDRLIEVCSDAADDTCGQLRTFHYDDRGFLRSEIHPEIGINGYGAISYIYDALGNVLQQSQSGTTAFTQTFRYDTAGRVVQVRDGSGRMLKELFYGRENDVTSMDRRAGKLVQAKRHNYVLADSSAIETSDVVVTEHFSYQGQAGQLSHYRVRGSHGVGFDLDIESYNDLGNITRLAYPACLYDLCSDPTRRELVSSYRYGLLTGVTDFVPSVTYHANGRIAAIEHANGVIDHRFQSGSGWPRLSQIQTVAGAEILRDSGTYAYDGSGNPIRIGAAEFFYDRAGRLIRGSVDTDPQVLLTRDYAYDVYGNLTVVSGDGQPPGALNPDPATNRLPAAHASYDEAGNADHLAVGLDATFDPFNRMKSLDGPALRRAYLYNSSDERMATLDLTAASRTEAWTVRGPDQQVLSRFALSGDRVARVKDYVHASGLAVATVETPDAAPEIRRHLHADHLGSTRLITDEDGEVLESLDYFPFGGNVADPGPETEELQFTGHERDDNSLGLLRDLDYMHARYYTSQLGRFTSVDQVLGTPEQPQSWNRYSYVDNNPLLLIDPTGNMEETSGSEDSKAGQFGCVETGESTGQQVCAETITVTPYSGFTLKDLIFGPPKLPRGHGPGCTPGNQMCQRMRPVGDNLPAAEALETVAVGSVELFLGGRLLRTAGSSGKAFTTAVGSKKLALGSLDNVVRAGDDGYSYLSVVNYSPIVQRAFEAGLVARHLLRRSAPLVLKGGKITAQEVRTLRRFRIPFKRRLHGF